MTAIGPKLEEKKWRARKAEKVVTPGLFVRAASNYTAGLGARL
jgi:hypothetical protein